MNNGRKTIAIIGAGVGGIVAAKTSFEAGFTPTVFEKSPNIGGIWSPKGLTWDGMHTNVGNYCVSLSDFPWPDGSLIFPKSRQVYQYFLDYIDQNKIGHFFKLQTWVESVRQLEDKRWEVTSVSNGQRAVEVFDFCIVSSGFNSKPCLPTEYQEGKSIFKGEIVHSADYRTGDDRFRGKKVLIIGAAASASEIAVDVVGWAESVQMLVRNKYFVAPKIVRKQIEENKYMLSSVDELFYERRKFYTHISTSEKLQTAKDFYRRLCPIQTNQAKSPPSIYINVEDYDLTTMPKFTTSEEFLGLVQGSKIQIKNDVVASFRPDGLVTKDNTFIEADVIICCTSHQANFSFFDEDTLAKLNFDHSNSNNPLVLYKNTWHPDLPNLAFIGIFRSIVSVIAELQSIWITKVFTGQLSLPPRETMMESIGVELERRRLNPDMQYPFPFNYLCDMVAREVGAMPDLDKIKEEDPELFEMLWTGPIFPEHFQLNIPEKRARAIDRIKHVNRHFNRIFTKEQIAGISLHNFT